MPAAERCRLHSSPGETRRMCSPTWRGSSPSRFRLVDVDARIVRLRLAQTFVISSESQDVADVVQVAISHEGITGHGEAAPIERYAESVGSAQAFVFEHADLV